MFENSLHRKWVITRTLSQSASKREHQTLERATLIITIYTLSVPGIILFLIFPAFVLSVDPDNLWTCFLRGEK